jgi:cation diffusion facilitator CzcD-associated flavoprotein CzcO
MTPDFDFVIVGSGFAGLGMAIALKKEEKHSFVVLEKAQQLGGTWRENHYPGCACDVPSHLYSFSFEPNPRWSRSYAPQPEILQYLEHCADKYGIRSHIRFNTAMKSAHFDDDAQVWRIRTGDGTLITARWLVSGIGALNRPAYPDIPGIEKFTGKKFHSAEWDHGFDLSGKRVAVVGTGASAIQFVPQIAPKVKKLHLFQRTAPWVMPRHDRAISPRERAVYAAAPATQRLYRNAIYSAMELTALALTVRPKWTKLVAARGKQHLRRQIKDEKLRKALTPTFLPGCKRILLSDDYYPSLELPQVEVVTDAIAEATESGLRAKDGTVREVDAIIYGTGFKVHEIVTPLDVRGRAGVSLNETWKDGMQAYLGTAIAGFPNFFMLTGPNTGLGHNSMIFMIEAQIGYVMDCVRSTEQRGATALEVKRDEQVAFNVALEQRLQKTVWASGCKSWYLDAHGKNRTLWPGFTVEYWLRTQRINRAHYAFTFPDAARATSSHHEGKANGAAAVPVGVA